MSTKSKLKTEDFYDKVGLLVLNEDNSKFLVCRKKPGNVTRQFILPGGQIEKGETDMECLNREISEELRCEVNRESLQFIGEYRHVAAGHKHKRVHLKLYQGRLIGEPDPASEIESLHWIGRPDLDNPDVSALLKFKIIPDLLERGLVR